MATVQLLTYGETITIKGVTHNLRDLQAIKIDDTGQITEVIPHSVRIPDSRRPFEFCTCPNCQTVDGYTCVNCDKPLFGM